MQWMPLSSLLKNLVPESIYSPTSSYRITGTRLTPEEQKRQLPLFVKIEQIETRFEAIIKKHPDVEITTSYSGGNLVKMINAYVEKHGIELIIMGLSWSKWEKRVFYRVQYPTGSAQRTLPGTGG